MELGFLLVVAASAAAGLVFRAAVSPALGRALLALGIGSLVLMLGVVGLTAVSRGRLLSVWTATGVAAVLLVVAALVLPFALAARWGRF